MFNAKNNLLLSFSAVFITIGFIMGTGSLYRYAFSYNIIMAVTLIMMFSIVIYQQFLPIHSSDTKNLTFLNQKYSLQGLILISFMIAIPLLSDIINIVPSFQIAIFYVSTLSISFFLNQDFRKKILDIYLIIIVVLSVISIIFLYLHLFTDLLSQLPSKTIDTRGTHDFYYIFSIVKPSIWIRNQSIFFEPGAFGFHIILAMLIAYKKKNNLAIFILLITSITTFSTTVLIFLFLLSMYHFLYSKHKILVLVTLLSIISVGIVTLLSTGNKLILDLFYDALFDKFSPSTENYKSFLTRFIFTAEAFKMFIDHVILGAGHYATAERLEVVTSGLTVNTSGLAGLLAELGLFGVFCIFLYIRLFKHFMLLAIPITLIWLNGEFLQYSPLAIFLLAHSADEVSSRIFPIKPSSINTV